MNNLEENIKRMEAELKDMREQLKQQKSKVWEPKDGEKVWLYQSWGAVNPCEYKSDFYQYHQMGMSFPTRKEAEKARDKQLAQMRIIRALREHEGDWVADWSDHNQDKYYIYLSLNVSKFKVTSRSFTKNFEIEMHSSREACEWVIENMQDDLKLLFGVE